jgi:hypothetical protein
LKRIRSPGPPFNPLTSSAGWHFSD